MNRILLVLLFSGLFVLLSAGLVAVALGLAFLPSDRFRSGFEKKLRQVLSTSTEWCKVSVVSGKGSDSDGINDYIIEASNNDWDCTAFISAPGDQVDVWYIKISPPEPQPSRKKHSVYFSCNDYRLKEGCEVSEGTRTEGRWMWTYKRQLPGGCWRLLNRTEMVDDGGVKNHEDFKPDGLPVSPPLDETRARSLAKELLEALRAAAR